MRETRVRLATGMIFWLTATELLALFASPDWSTFVAASVVVCFIGGAGLGGSYWR